MNLEGCLPENSSRPSGTGCATTSAACCARWDLPAVLVTHDGGSAGAGDELVVLDQDQVRQSGPVDEVFGRPSDAAVARIVGVDTVEPGKVLTSAMGGNGAGGASSWWPW